MPYKATILTISDKGYAGEREDKSGPILKLKLEEMGFETAEVQILPDDRTMISSRLKEICLSGSADLILTTGGTGAAPRDITPEASMDVIERPMPGLAELIRFEGMKFTKRAVLSRGVSGICKETLIINLAGSPKAAAEGMDILEPVLEHALHMLKSINLDHK
ncbi:MogA/MoaB family molybdenum cofactor biosynthesis protein [Spirochaeta isovalerica]|uniref:Molybdopterin adenylyltransferase n=1 Tax=Spirochaeta isovalerica TaxID=150 RepID=A0A841R9L5_9SPIO|nr:MogA/MoaB family molybdenum cofactor biosynthesis protein [Spirochaeta isovalerica]MBB6482034.1 molybdenum cofactor synthesis domain-containing protein [Spirochaeta isovalerica]